MLIGTAEASDADWLAANSIDVVVMTDQTTAWPHTATVAIIAIDIEPDGQYPRHITTAMAGWLNGLRASKKLAIADRNGGVNQAAFLMAVLEAARRSITFAVAIAELDALFPLESDGDDADANPYRQKALINDALRAHGVACYS